MKDILKEEIGFELGTEDLNNPNLPIMDEQIEEERDRKSVTRRQKNLEKSTKEISKF
ncbi:unnamed protein product, partial [Heterotrigona itama]